MTLNISYGKCGTAQYGTAQYGTVRYGTVRHSAVQHYHAATECGVSHEQTAEAEAEAEAMTDTGGFGEA
jgi:hypothetical protein